MLCTSFRATDSGVSGPAVRAGGATQRVALTQIADGSFVGLATIAPDDVVRVDVLDRRGRLIGSSRGDADAPEPEPSPPAVTPELRYIGPSLPIVGISPITNVMWWSPTARNVASVSGMAASLAAPIAA